MTDAPIIAERIRKEFTLVLKEYAAFDRTLDALAAISFVTQSVKEIAEETEFVDFRPKLEPVGLDAEPYTPDGLIIQKKNSDLIVELKTSWNNKDIPQVTKYAQSSAYRMRNGTKRQFKSDKCILLGYQNPPGDAHLDELFDTWDKNKFGFPLVVFRYSLEQAPEGDRIYFARVAYGRNGLCPASNLAKAINSSRGFPVSTNIYRPHRTKFHKTNDQTIASYAAVLWWTKYVSHYLSEEQRSEMAERGRLTSPLTIKVDQIDRVPTPSDVEVPLGPNDVRRALEFLTQARLVSFKKRQGVFEIELKEDRFIRIPTGSPIPQTGAQQDISTKILARWATHKVKKPIDLSQKKKMGRRRRHKTGTTSHGSGWLFPN